MYSLPARFFSNKALYLGLGEMGYNIAAKLSHTFPIAVWNRTASKSVDHSREYKTASILHTNPFDSGLSDVDFVFSCLPTSKEVSFYADLLIQASSSIKPGLVWVDNTSGVPMKSSEIAARLGKIGVGFIDAPVSGGRQGAINGTLSVMVGGKEADFLKAKPLLQTLAKSLIHVGEDVGCAHAVKSLNNLLYACNVLFALKIARALKSSGLDVEKALSAMVKLSGGSTALNRVLHFVSHDNSINLYFKTNLLIKDIDIAFSQLKIKGNDKVFPVFSAVRQLFFEATQTNWESFDVFDMFKHLEQLEAVSQNMGMFGELKETPAWGLSF
jgi:3-hydroxyisobutyrate dehydrogenase